MQIAREAGLDVRAGEIYPDWRGNVSEDYLELIDVAYSAGAEKGKEVYEREHCRHTVPLPDALKVMQEQVAEACAKACDELHNDWKFDDLPDSNSGPRSCATVVRAGEWRKYIGETK